MLIGGWVGVNNSPSDTAIVLVGGTLKRGPGSVVTGNVTDVKGAWFTDALRVGVWNPIARPYSLQAAVPWVVQTIVFAIVAIIITATMPRQVGAVARQLQRRTLASFGWGALGSFIVIPVSAVILTITLVGLLLVIPGVFLGLPLTFLFIGTAVAVAIGGAILRGSGQRGNLILAALIGVAILSVLRFVPFFGLLAVVLAWFFGLGALVLAVAEWQRGRRELRRAARASAAGGGPPQPPSASTWPAPPRPVGPAAALQRRRPAAPAGSAIAWAEGAGTATPPHEPAGRPDGAPRRAVRPVGRRQEPGCPPPRQVPAPAAGPIGDSESTPIPATIHPVRRAPASGRGATGPSASPPAIQAESACRARRVHTRKVRRMFRVVSNDEIAPQLHRMVIEAPRVAKARKPGQFVIVRCQEGGERIPLTIADDDVEAGTITLIIQAVGLSTKRSSPCRPAASCATWPARSDSPPRSRTGARWSASAAAPARPSSTRSPRGWRRPATSSPPSSAAAARSTSSCRTSWAPSPSTCTSPPKTARSARPASSPCRSSASSRTPQTRPAAVYAVGPVPMMKAVANLTRDYGVRTIVSLNPIMVDGTGMCGGCRVTVGGQVKFACVDGPEFDGHLVDYDELFARQATYLELDEHGCRLDKQLADLKKD